MDLNNENMFPLSKESKIKGSRSLVRIKVLQILYSFLISKDNLERDFNHIFYREFNFGDDEQKSTRLLKPSEVYELEADKPIIWEDSQLEFAKDLLAFILNNEEKLNNYIEKYAKNWSLERISIIDKIIMMIAIIELLEFETIPAKVSIDEAVNLAKSYSTDKSSDFINGVLDAVLKELQENNLLNKKGMGLL